MGGNSYAQAYQKWFSAMETERRRRRIRPGRPVPCYPEPPPNPSDIADAIADVGRARVESLLEVHRSTVARWINGDTAMPRAAWLAVKMLADGKLPGMSDAWEAIRIEGDELCIVGTNFRYSAAQIIGFQYVELALTVAQDKIKRLESQLIEALQEIDFGAANDAYTAPQDVRSKAFGSGRN